MNASRAKRRVTATMSGGRRLSTAWRRLRADTAGRRPMARLEIIGSNRSTYTQVVCMVCEEKKIEYVLTEKPLRAPELFAVHPLGKMPVMRHGDVQLFESKAIATYVD